MPHNRWFWYYKIWFCIETVARMSLYAHDHKKQYKYAGCQSPFSEIFTRHQLTQSVKDENSDDQIIITITEKK